MFCLKACLGLLSLLHTINEILYVVVVAALPCHILMLIHVHNTSDISTSIAMH